jgi:NAD(P)-dependent dehydrogenase (short-subunit alcohol dehydrogenase family)
MPRPVHFRGRTAIVTGAASGIGREIARQLAAAGAFVLVTDLPDTNIDTVAAAITEAGGSAVAMPVDVTRPEQLEAAIGRVVTEHGRLDLMFNNAGVAIFGEFDLVSLEEWDTTIDVNLRGAAHGATLAYRQMVAQGHGHIINTASVAGLVPVPLQAHYVATKHALIGMSKTLQLEAADHGVDVTIFCPAFVESGMFDNNTLHGTMEGTDTRKLVPISPLATDVAVRRLLAGVARRRSWVITPFYGRLGWWLERLSPALSMRLHRVTLQQTRRRAVAMKAAR